jgi:glycosyltransferase involved in cell wall biosynthesis
VDFGRYPFTEELSINLVDEKTVVDYIYCADYHPILGTKQFNFQRGHYCREGITLKQDFPKYSIFKRLIYEIRFGLIINKKLKEKSPKIVILSSVPLISSFLIVSKRKKHKVIFWHQDIYSKAMSHELITRFGLLGRLIGVGFSELEKYLLRSSDWIVSISQSFFDTYRNWQIELTKVSFLANWAPVSNLRKTDKNNKWALTNNLPNDAIKILYAGTIGRKHDITILLELLNALIKRGKKTHLIIVSNEYFELQNQIRNKVFAENTTLLPLQPWSSVSDMISAADICLTILEPQASDYSVPSKLATYLACGGVPIGFINSQNQAATIIEGVGGLVTDSSRFGIDSAAEWIMSRNERQLKLISRKSLEFANVNFAIELKVEFFRNIFAELDRRIDNA